MTKLDWETKLYKAEMEFAEKETMRLNTESYFLNLKKKSNFLSKVIDYFDTHNIEFGFLGGSVRESIIGTLENFPRDVDIIFDGNDMEFDNFLKENRIGYFVNSFDGRKIVEGTDSFTPTGLTFDIWSLQNHYLINEGKYSKDFENVPKTTFINYDSIFFNWTKKELIGEYFDCLKTRTIDFVGEEKYAQLNRCPNVSICKIVLLCNKEFKMSDRVKNWIMKQLESYTDFGSFIFDFERHMNYGVGKFTKDIIRDFLKGFGIECEVWKAS